jgi:hypothetical protein
MFALMDLGETMMTNVAGRGGNVDIANGAYCAARARNNVFCLCRCGKMLGENIFCPGLLYQCNVHTYF